MSDTIQISVKEYQSMKEEIALLKDNVFLEKLNRLFQMLYEEKYGLYLGNNTSDLTEAALLENWSNEKSVWDDL